MVATVQFSTSFDDTRLTAPEIWQFPLISYFQWTDILKLTWTSLFLFAMCRNQVGLIINNMV